MGNALTNIKRILSNRNTVTILAVLLGVVVGLVGLHHVGVYEDHHARGRAVIASREREVDAGYGHLLQVRAVVEQVVVAGKAVGNQPGTEGHLTQVVAVREHRVAKGLHRVGQRHRFQFSAAAEAVVGAI